LFSIPDLCSIASFVPVVLGEYMGEERNDSPRFCTALDGFILRVGRIVSWLGAVLIVVIIAQVILRYVFGRGLVVLEEIQWHLYAVGFMIGLSYALTTDSHIRLDLLYGRFPQQRKAKVEIFGTIFLLLPMIITVLIHSWPFLLDSISVNERSDAPMGLCCRWAIKAVIPISFLLLATAALSRLVRAVAFLKIKKSLKEGRG